MSHPQFLQAVEAIDQGDLVELKRLIAEHPTLVMVRHDATEEPYSGYFYQATLLHHIAFNPTRGREIPDNIMEITEFLLQSGADPNAVCGGGPSQPETAHGTVIGLVASGSQPNNKDLVEPLITLLAKYGAAIEYGETGVNMFGALYHTVENKRQKDAAMVLYNLGHDIDMVFAAGLGLLHSVKGYIHPDGYLKEGADRLFTHHRRDGMKEATGNEVLQDCLLAAAVNNEVAVIEYLLSLDLDINAWRNWGPFSVTPLHGACWSGWLEATQFLIKQGANTFLHDPKHNTTAIGWAHYCGRTEVFDWFMENEQYMNLFDAMEFGKTERFKQLLGDQDPDMAIGQGERGVLLRMAAYSGYVKVVALLLDKGADPQLTNSEGKSALDLAKAQKHLEVISLLS